MARSVVALCLVSSFALASFVSPAVGCLNDGETKNREREFKSEYKQDAPPPEEGDTPLLVAAYPKTSFALGGVMALAGVTVGLTSRRRKG